MSSATAPKSPRVARSRQLSRAHRRRAARLTGYLAAGIGATTVATPSADAAIVVINTGSTGFNIGGVNAGLSTNSDILKNNFPFGINALKILNAYTYGGYTRPNTGLSGQAGLLFAAAGSFATPTKLTSGQSISSSLTFRGGPFSQFRYGAAYSSSVSPNFAAGSYMGFKTSQNNYGWLEVTWNSTSNQFQIFSGAYESTPNTPIAAGTIVPEPATIALIGVAGLAMGAGAVRRIRKARRDAAAA